MSKRTVIVNSVPKEVTEIPFEPNETWSTIQMADGATAKVRPIIKEVLKFKDVFDDNGKPLYNINFAWVMHIVPPPEDDDEFSSLKEKGGLVN